MAQICRFERKIGRKTYLIECTELNYRIEVKAFVEKPVKLKGQEVHCSFFTPTEWLGFQQHAELILRPPGGRK